MTSEVTEGEKSQEGNTIEGFKVLPIKEGTVIDHIPCGMALKVLRIIGLPSMRTSIVSIVMNVPSGKSEKKDIVKVEDKELIPSDVEKIALIAPEATINIIRNYKVVGKHSVSLPERIRSIGRCGNPNCITNKEREPITPEFNVISSTPPRICCRYCEREVENIADAIA